jgi:hypothetical protein
MITVEDLARGNVRTNWALICGGMDWRDLAGRFAGSLTSGCVVNHTTGCCGGINGFMAGTRPRALIASRSPSPRTFTAGSSEPQYHHQPILGPA